jgi:hypothetical protein
MKSKLHSLLNESPISYYWIGFLLADGHFKGNRLCVSLSIKDEAHLKTFLKYVGYDNSFHYRTIKCNGKSYPQISAAFSDPLVTNISKKFNMSCRKTYEPPDLSKINKDLFWPLLIGFIDGDGSIRAQSGGRPDSFITIKIHSSWLSNLNLMSHRLHSHLGIKCPVAKINTKGYAVVNFANSIAVKFLKQTGIALHLPYLERKWSRINLSHLNRFERATRLHQEILKLLTTGKTINEICQLRHIHHSTVSFVLKKSGYKGLKAFRLAVLI